MQYDIGGKITEGVYIGSLKTAISLADKNPYKIDFIINLSGTLFKSDIPTFYVIMPDATIDYYDVDEFIKRFSVAVNVLKKKRAEGLRVLVNCHEGINRSATVIALYLVTCGWEPDAIYTHMENVNKKRNRPALTNESFRYLITTKYAIYRYGL